MNKLTDLLEKMGASPELINEFTATLEQHEKSLKETIRGEFEKSYTAKEEKAKSICVEEVEKEKVRLARKVQVYLESKQREIEEAAQRQRAIEESEATQALRRIKALIEGNDPNVVGGDTRGLQAARDTNARLEKVLASMKEERDQAVRSAARARKIAEDVLKHNQALEESLRGVAEGKKPWVKPWEKKAEEKGAKDTKKPVASEKEVKAESKQPAPAKRLDESRKVAAKPQTARPAVTESRTQKSQSAGSDIDSIAAAL